MSLSVSRWFGDWRHLIEKPASADEVEPVIEKGSVPSYAFYVLLTSSTVIATLGLLANSAAVIIGAMIVAPKMNPIISISYGLVAGRGALVMRSLLTLVTGMLLTISLAFLFTEAIGWKLAGSEIVSRLRPSLLDLGVALAAGAAAAFAYTRPGISSALAGIAIAVALVPPLCTVGILMALGREVNAEVGIALDDFSIRGPFLLYLTNIIGIVLAGSSVFFWRYYRRQLRAMLALALIFSCLIIVVPPLGVGMDNLLVRNQVHRSLIVETRALFSSEQDFRFINLSVRIREGTVFVRGDIVSAPGLFTTQVTNALQARLSELVKMPVVLEFGIIREVVVRSTGE